MIWRSVRRKALILCITLALLALSLTLVACASGVQAGNAGNSNISTNSGQSGPSASSTSGSSGASSSLQSINQQVQNAVQNIDGAQNDTGSADATATSENGAPQQP